MKETIDHSISEIKPIRSSYRDRINILESYGSPVPDYFLHELADHLEEWVMDEEKEALRIGDFLLEFRIDPSSYLKWRKRNPRLQQAHEFALAKIASRRDRGAIKKYYDRESAFRMMPNYDPEYLPTLRETEIAKQLPNLIDGKHATEFITIIERETPTSPLVPEIRKDNNDE